MEDLDGLSLRAADTAECLAAGLSPEEAVVGSVLASEECFTVGVDGGVLCYWGYRRGDLADMADIWLLTTQLVEEYPVTFYREGRRLLHALLGEFTALRAVVHEDYTRSVRWLQRLGFIEVAWNGGFATMVRYR